MRRRRNTVVDFAPYRAARAQRPLPLTDRPAPLEPPRRRSLSREQIEHRERMLAFLSRRSG